MSEQGEGRRYLKAIMFTDIQDYSAKMSKDERGTVELVLAHREIVRDTLPAYEGHVHETIGDAFVVLFDSVVNAVNCGVELQRRLAAWNADRPREEQVWIRIGIHLGDIIMRDGGIYGDGVNIAARVEQLAEPGGICLTEEVRLQVRGKVDYTLQSLGRVELKNISEPPPVYRLIAGAAPIAGGAGAAGKWIVLGAVALVIAGVAAWWLTRDDWPETTGPGDTPAAMAGAEAAPGAQPEAAQAPESPSLERVGGGEAAQRSFNRGLEAWLAAEFSAAERHLAAALELAPDEPMPRLLLSRVHKLTGRDGLAQLGLEHVGRVASGGKDDPVSALLEVIAAAESVSDDATRVEKAWKVFERRHEATYLAHVMVATPHFAAPPQEGTDKILDAAIALDAGRAVAHAFKAQADVERGKWAEALAAVKAGLERNPGSPWLAMLGARVQLKRGETDTARKELLAVLDREPGLLAARSLLATAELAAGNEEARKSQAALVLSDTTPVRSRAQFALDHGRELAARGRLAEALDVYEIGATAATSGRLFGTALDLRSYAARMAIEIEDADKLKHHLEAARAIAAEPELSQVYRKYMVTWIKRQDGHHALLVGEADKALEQLERLQAMPDEAFTFFDKGMQLGYLAWATYAALRRFDEAARVAREDVFECYSDHAVARVAGMAGQTEAALAAYAKAIEVLQGCRVRFPSAAVPLADALSRQAELMQKTGDEDGARKALDALDALWPTADPGAPMLVRAREVRKKLGR